MNNDLGSRFVDLNLRLGFSAEQAAANVDGLVQAYDSNVRFFNTLDGHIYRSIEELDTAEILTEVPHRDLIEFAIFYHAMSVDSPEIRINHAKGERISFGLLSKINHPSTKQYGKIISAMSGFTKPNTEAAKFAYDIDHAHLGYEFDDFLSIEDSWQKERSLVEGIEKVIEKRVKFFEKVKKMSGNEVFFTDYFRDIYGTQAKINLDMVNSVEAMSELSLKTDIYN